MPAETDKDWSSLSDESTKNILSVEQPGSDAITPKYGIPELQEKLAELVSAVVQTSDQEQLEEFLIHIENFRRRKTPGGYSSEGETRSVIVIKRPRGRPKKEPGLAKAVHISAAGTKQESDAMGAADVVKRSRGRPRKYPPKEAPLIRRGPGRPRKIIAASFPEKPAPLPDVDTDVSSGGDSGLAEEGSDPLAPLLAQSACRADAESIPPPPLLLTRPAPLYIDVQAATRSMIQALGLKCELEPRRAPAIFASDPQ